MHLQNACHGRESTFGNSNGRNDLEICAESLNNRRSGGRTVQSTLVM